MRGPCEPPATLLQSPCEALAKPLARVQRGPAKLLRGSCGAPCEAPCEAPAPARLAETLREAIRVACTRSRRGKGRRDKETSEAPSHPPRDGARDLCTVGARMHRTRFRLSLSQRRRVEVITVIGIILSVTSDIIVGIFIIVVVVGV